MRCITPLIAVAVVLGGTGGPVGFRRYTRFGKRTRGSR
jgi:hypothetical protein